MALSHRMKIVVILGAKQQTIVFLDKVCCVWCMWKIDWLETSDFM